MTMTPHDFRALLDDALSPEPPARPVSSDVAAGRRLLRRRRAVVTLGSAALVAVAGTAWAMAPGSGTSATDHGTGIATQPSSPTTDASLLDRCRDGNQSERATAAIFGADDPVVKAVSRTEHQVLLAIESGDGSHWAECFVHLDNQEFASGMTVWDASGRDRDSSYSFGPGCGLADGGVDPDCRTFSVSWVDRRPAAVAAVEFVTGDDRTTTVRSRDGYIVFNHLGAVPPGAPRDPMSWTFPPIRTITFLDASGRPIAAEAQDGSGSGPDHERIGDLPSIREYPGLRGDQAIY
jgi:hypothetical protein